MVNRVLFDIARAFPHLTPEVVWRERSHGQMMAYWHAAREQRDRELGMLAVVNHAAVSAAVINTIGGKEATGFQELVDRLLGGEDEQNGAEPQAMPDVFQPAPTQSLEGFEEF